MEFWPVKIDWDVYQEHLAKGEYLPSVCRLDFECDGPEDTGSVNAALSDFFPLLLPHLPNAVRDAMGPLVGAIATCGIEDWPWPNNGPEWLMDNSENLEDVDVGLVYSPTTVAKIVAAFQQVPPDQMANALALAWSRKSNDPDDYQFATVEHFEDSRDFLKYLLGWYAPFQEAAAEGHGVGIGGG